ncbi:DUF261 domain-containing protein [Borrelia venezuelensis]|uniref:DUF261 domain-containing protein n=1 Tax=Borrelia venezuelensis TaxID=1653839 RepID=UPI001FF15215|nr:DUF261 domain-containing protein [Borrelia venezuelensis]UPA12550.1 DUF261 domain-containing protein [Borrelia venezuelensis]
MRVYQSDSRLVVEIQKWGCYLLSLHYYVSMFTEQNFEFYDINDNYHKFINLGYIKDNCYILNPCKILNYFRIKRCVRYENQHYRCSSGEFEISEVRIKNTPGSHFMATNNTSVLYDSLKLKERGREYHLKSKRVFTQL